jgi:mannose-1-phosphate guanylyltransferase
MNNRTAAASIAVATEGVRGIVLAGGYERGEFFDGLFPRPLAPVAHAPLICYTLRWLGGQGVSNVTVCANSAARRVRSRACSHCYAPSRSLLGCRQASSMRVEHLEDWMPRGAAGCVRDAAIRTDARTFVVVDGTSVPLVDLGGLLETHRVCQAAVTVVAYHDPSLGNNGRGLRPSGAYVFDRRVLDHIPDTGFQDIKEGLIPRLYRAGERVVTHIAHGASPRMVSAGSYLALNQWMVERVCGAPEPPAEHRRMSEALVHESASVSPGARLVGPVLIGPGTSVEASSTVLGPTSIGAGCVVGAGAVVSRSAIWEDCVVGEEALVDRCLLADGVSVAPRTSVVGALRLAGNGNGAWSLRSLHLEALSPTRLLAGLTRPATDHV